VAVAVAGFSSAEKKGQIFFSLLDPKELVRDENSKKFVTV